MPMPACRATLPTVCRLLFAILLCLRPVTVFAQSAPPAFAWVEAEKPDSANFTFDTQASGPPEILSEGHWLFKNIEKGDLAKAVPPEGLLLKYRLTVPEDGSYQVWARVGYEWVRPPIEWRIGDGDWQKVGTETRTTSLMRLATWSEVAWLPLGNANLKTGGAELQIRYREPNKDGHLLIGLDCLAVVKGRFVPEGRLKPGESYDRSTDRAAAENVFHFPDALPTDPAARLELSLNGQWQAARYDDPDMDAQPYAPVTTLPSPDAYPLRWMGIATPSSAWNKPELAFGHRLLYRARVAVPTGLQGRSFCLHFSGTNWIASVFVNGVFVGSHKGVLVPWDIDISRAVRPGETNEIIVAIKSPYYAMDTKSREGARNTPNESNFIQYARWVAPIYPSTKGEGDGLAFGLVNPVKLVAAGPVYVADVFARPSVANKRLDADVTVKNPGAETRHLTVRCEAIGAKSGQVEQTFPPVDVTVAPGAEQNVTVGGGWANPKLWWPVDHPDLYTLRTTLAENNKPLDVHNQTFGFREITRDGIHIRLNGVIRNFWNWVGVSGEQSTPEDWLRAFRAEGNRFWRIGDDNVVSRFFPWREAQLDFYDQNGIPGRLSTCIDGMFITYNLDNPLVWENFTEHVAQATKAYRNHPSIILYSVENELLYINAQNTGQIDMAEPKALAMIEAGRKNDPTRLFMVDGGGALKGDLLETNGEHYPEPPSDFYPDAAYTFTPIADHSSRWPWDHKRPLILGESFFYAGKLEDQAWIGGDRVFRGRDEANKGASAFAQLMVEGYRWQGAAGICPWVSLERLPGAQKVFNDLAVFTRKRAHRFMAGRPGSLLVKVLNDTLSADPVTFTWAVTIGSKQIAGQTVSLSIEPGTGQEQILRFTPPPSAHRQNAVLLLRVFQNGKLGFEDRKPLTILPPVASIRLPDRKQALTPAFGHPSPNSGRGAGAIVLYDRSGKLGPYLAARHISVTKIASLAELKGKSGLLLVGPDTLTATEAGATDILAFAARGGRAIVLEQTTPLIGAALPAPLRATGRQGGYAFAQALGTPVFAGFGPEDFTDWAASGPTFQHAYYKAAGARSLIECGDGLNYSALLEAPCGQGVIVAAQMRIGANLGKESAADQLLKNLLETYSAYTPPHGVTALYAPTNAPVQKAMEVTGIRTQRVNSVTQALDAARYRVAVLPGDANTLRALQKSVPALTRFTAAGGWLMLWGVEPDGLAALNQIVGVAQPIRPFRLERVTMQGADSPLTATLGNRDLTFYSPQEIMFGDYWLSEHEYSYVVGADDVAPFCKMPDGPDDLLAYKPTFDDHDPYNYVNGLLNSDSWRYIRQIWVDKDGAKPLVFGFRQPATIRQINLWNNTNYWTIKDLDIIFDGDTAHPLRVVLPPDGSRNAFTLSPPRRITKSITLQIRSWRGEKEGDKNRLVGLDNVQFLREISPEEARKKIPLDNIGGLVAFPQGRGGILLNQIRLMEGEPNPENSVKKIRLAATLLQNLGAGARSSEVAIPGVNVQYAPLDITRWCNRHIKKQGEQAGWFGDSNSDLSHLKVGRQFLGEVEYHIPDYVNAPVPQSVMLGGPNAPDALRSLPGEVTGIAVGRKADALYFLHTADVHNPVADWERRDTHFQSPELFVYRVHYADGTQTDIPIHLEDEVDHWLQAMPHPLTNARVAWSTPFPNAPADAPRPVLYTFAWNNPKPDTSITTIDILSGKDARRATPALLAITAGQRVGK